MGTTAPPDQLTSMGGVRIPIRCVEPECSSETTIDVATGQSPFPPERWYENELGFWCPNHPPRRVECTCVEGPAVLAKGQIRCSRCSYYISSGCGAFFMDEGVTDRCLLEKKGHPGDHHGTTHDWPRTDVSASSLSFDPVDRPAHYADRQIEVIDFIEDSGWGEGFCLGNAVKYITRAGKKDPEKKIQDLEKARWYLNRFIEKGKP